MVLHITHLGVFAVYRMVLRVTQVVIRGTVLCITSAYNLLILFSSILVIFFTCRSRLLQNLEAAALTSLHRG